MGRAGGLAQSWVPRQRRAPPPLSVYGYWVLSPASQQRRGKGWNLACSPWGTHDRYKCGWSRGTGTGLATGPTRSHSLGSRAKDRALLSLMAAVFLAGAHMGRAAELREAVVRQQAGTGPWPWPASLDGETPGWVNRTLPAESTAQAKVLGRQWLGWMAGQRGGHGEGGLRGSAFRASASLEQVTELLWAYFLSDRMEVTAPMGQDWHAASSAEALAAGGTTTITTDHSWTAGSPGDRAGPAPSESFPFHMPLPHPLPAAPTPARGRPAAGGGRGPVHSSVSDVFRPKQEQGLGVPASLQPGTRQVQEEELGAGRVRSDGAGGGAGRG